MIFSFTADGRLSNDDLAIEGVTYHYPDSLNQAIRRFGHVS